MNHNPQVKRMLSTNNHYDILGVSKTANSKEIKKAYRQMALKYHPDKNPIPQAKQVFNKIVNSYNVLSDDAKRKSHDADMTQPKQKEQPKPQREQQSNKNAKKPAPHFKSHYYDQFKQEKESQKRQNTSKKAQQEQKKTQTKAEFSNSFNKKPSMPQQNSFSRSQERPKYRSSYVQRKNSNGMVLLTFFIFIIIWYFMPSLSGTPAFLLTAGGEYTLKLKTKLLKVPYYVKANYDQQNPISEQTIQRAFVRKLQKQCQQSLNQKKAYEKIIQKASNDIQRNALIQMASNVSLKSCKKIIKLLKKNPSIKMTTFKNNILGL